jgi:hypothetical protein
VVADAAPLDATPVACNGPEDCANPDDPCLLPGTCEDRVCHFEAMNCSDLDGECTKGICADGECQPKAVREGQGCGAGVMVCGAFDDCGGFADVCDESGTQGRSCTDSTCQAGTCVTEPAYDGQPRLLARHRRHDVRRQHLRLRRDLQLHQRLRPRRRRRHLRDDRLRLRGRQLHAQRDERGGQLPSATPRACPADRAAAARHRHLRADCV